MDLKHLRYFLAVAEELNFTRAAARLRISQPPLSQMIVRMEEEAGFKLFVRTKRKVTLTEAGKVLLEDSRVILKNAEDAVRRAERAAKGETGHLRVAFIPWADFTPVFSEIFRRLGEVIPDVTVDFHSMPAFAAADALKEGRVDVAFLSQPPLPPSGVDHELVLVDDIIAAISDRHELAKESIIPLTRLANEPHIVVAQSRINPYHNIVHTLCLQSGFELKARHLIDHPQTTLALVAAGAGVSLIPASYQNIQRPGVTYRKIFPTAQISMVAAWKKGIRTPVLEIFLKVLRAVRQDANGL